jgi:predicted Zn-dependent peptidase
MPKTDFQGEGPPIMFATDKVQAIVQLGYPGVSIDSPDYVSLALIDEALSDLSSRLFIRIRDKQSLAYFVGTGQLLGGRSRGSSFIMPEPARTPPSRSGMNFSTKSAS